MADDLGYGDAAPFGLERSKVPTPGMTQLAKEGMRFTDAHSIASVCVPSRLAIMTGRYPYALKGSLAAAPGDLSLRDLHLGIIRWHIY